MLSLLIFRENTLAFNLIKRLSAQKSCRSVQIFFDSEQLIVFCDAVGTR